MNDNLKDLREVIDLIFNTVDAVKAAKLNDGKIDLKDFPLLFPLFDDASVAIDGIEKALPSWANATSEERNVLLEHFKTRFDLPNDQLEVKIEKAILAATIVLEIFLDLKD